MGSKPGALIKTFLESGNLKYFGFLTFFSFVILDFASNKHTPTMPTP